MLCAEWNMPFVPGDLNYAGTLAFPVRYLTVDGAAGSEVLTDNAGSYDELFVTAAKQLEAEGVHALTGNCGYKAGYQDIAAAAVNVPVFMSSLVQAPMILRMLGLHRRLAVIVANGKGSPRRCCRELDSVTRLACSSMASTTNPTSTRRFLQEAGTLDDELLRREVVETAVEVAESDPTVGAIFLECSDLPPTSGASTRRPAFQSATGPASSATCTTRSPP